MDHDIELIIPILEILEIEVCIILIILEILENGLFLCPPILEGWLEGLQKVLQLHDQRGGTSQSATG